MRVLIAEQDHPLYAQLLRDAAPDLEVLTSGDSAELSRLAADCPVWLGQPDLLATLLRQGHQPQWLQSTWQVSSNGRQAEWQDGEVFVSLPRPGGDAWARVDLEAGEAEFELTDRGWISYLNDLHKGRNTGKAWSWFIDIFAAACLVFCLTGFFILKMHATKRPFTWPMVGMGLVIPVVLALLFIH